MKNTGNDFKLNQEVYHKEIYNGNEKMKIVGIKENELLLEGDYSGGTHDVIQKDWMPIKGVFLNKGIENKTTIISAFPATGKSHYCNGDYIPQDWCSDSDSSKFSWLRKGVRNHTFPSNYIEHIKDGMGNYAVMFISSHKEVRDALVENEIDFTLVYPDRSLKSEYIERYKERGNDQSFIDLVESNWDKWIDELEAQEGCTKIVLGSGEYLSNTDLKLKVHEN